MIVAYLAVGALLGPWGFGLVTDAELIQDIARIGIIFLQGEVHMVDVSAKEVTDREAVAEGRITMSAETLELIRSGGHKKGDVLGIARIAGIMGAKKTSELVPLCHPLMLTRVNIELEVEPGSSSVLCTATVRTTERTGVEMEALTAVQVTLLVVGYIG